MSCYALEDEKLIILANKAWAYRDKIYAIRKNEFTEQDILDLLVLANYESVNHRYSENREIPKIEFKYLSYPVSEVETLVLCATYHYQSCEKPDYKDSPAYHLINAIELQAKQHLPGYDEAVKKYW